MGQSQETFKSFPLLGLAVLLIVTAPAVFAADSDEIPWAENLDTAIEQAQAEGKLIFLDVYADWCPPCQRMEAETFTDQAVISALQDYVPLKVDSDANPDIARQYGVQALPTLFVLTPDGSPVYRQEGFASAEGLIELLRAATTRVEEIASLEEEVREAPGDIEKVLELAQVYNEIGRAGETVKLLERSEAEVDADTPQELRAEFTFALGLAYLIDGAYAKGVERLEGFLAEHPDHAETGRAEYLILQGKVFGALAHIDDGDYDVARTILTELAETTEEPQVAAFTEAMLGQLEVLGRPAPEWAATWTGDRSASVSALEGKVVAVAFVSPESARSGEVAKRLEAFRQAHGGRDFESVAIVSQPNSQQEADANEVRAWAETHELTYPVGIDREGGTTFGSYKAERTPWLALIGRDGVVHYLGEYDEAEVNDKLGQLLEAAS